MKRDLDLSAAATLLIALASSACGSPSNTTATIPHPSIVEVTPTEFPAVPSCIDAVGGLRSYVATLFDVGSDPQAPASPGFALPSSAPAPCRQSVAFGWVVPSHYYRAKIDGYDRTDLEPLAPGLPILRDPATGEPVAPRWTTQCGFSDPVLAEQEITRQITDCVAWTDSGTSGPSQVRVAIAGALGAVACGEGSDQVERFIVRRDGTELGSAACGEAVTLADLPAGQHARLDVLAFAKGGSSAWLGGTCSVTPVPGVSIDATCYPFSNVGAIDLAIADVLSAAAASCNGSLERVSLVVDGTEPAVVVTSAACGGSRQFVSLTPGAHTIEASVLAHGSAEMKVRCTASVEPGLVAQATCAAAASE